MVAPVHHLPPVDVPVVGKARHELEGRLQLGEVAIGEQGHRQAQGQGLHHQPGGIQLLEIRHG